MSDAFRTHDGRTLEQAASDLVQREVLCCMSSMVATLARGSTALEDASEPAAMELSGLAGQAFELSSPLLDFEDAAREAGWAPDTIYPEGELQHGYIRLGRRLTPSWEGACYISKIEPRELEVYEHWAVTTWFAEKLQAAGERVDTDFAGLNVWARTTTGQAIHADAVVERITREMHAPAADAAK